MPLIPRKKYFTPTIISSGVGFSLPYSIDFSTQPDGALPSPWVAGATWAVSSGVAVCTPASYSAELLTDPGLEANYTAGKCDTLTKSGSPTLAQSVDVHGGSKAQEFTAIALNDSLYWSDVTGMTDTWGVFRVWVKRTAGTSSKVSLWLRDMTGGSWFAYEPVITAASYTEVVHTRMFKGNARLQWKQFAATGFDTVLIDDGSIKRLTSFAELVALLPRSASNVTVKANITSPRTVQAGVIARADATTNPQNFLIALLTFCYAGSNYVLLYKCVNGVYTYVTGAAVTYYAARNIEIRCSGTSIELWYNNAQVSTTQTVDEATINNNTIHGMFSSDGGNSLNSFFSHDSTVNIEVFIGGSNTSGIDTQNGFAIYTHNNIVEIATANYHNKGVGGADSWYGLVRLQTDVIDLAPDVVFIEQAVNDAALGLWGSDRTNGWWPCQEALIRRLRTELPNARLVLVNLVQQEEYLSSPRYITSRDNWEALCEKYDVEHYRIDLWLQGVIGDPTPTEAQCRVYGDFVHFTQTGHTEIANMLQPHLSGWFPHGSAGWTGDLGDYGDPTYADVSDFTNTPIIRNGIDNDGETGTGWSTSGNSRVSSTAGDTISWTGTFTAFGLDGIQGSQAMTWKIDGGAENSFNFSGGAIVPIYATTRGPHTVVFKVVSGTCTIDRFLAI